MISALKALISLPRSAVLIAKSEARDAGDRYRDAHRWIDAAKSYLHHLEAYSTDFSIWVQAGNCLKEAGAYDQALAAYWRAVALDEDDADVFLQLGHLYKLMGRSRESAEAYRASFLRKPDDATATELLAQGIDVWRGDAPERSLRKQIGKGAVGSPTILWFLRGGSNRQVGGEAKPSEERRAADELRDKGKWSEAAMLYRQHVVSRPHDFAIWVQAGNCHKEAQEYDDAILSYWRALALDAADADVYLQYGHALKLLGRKEEAVEAYRTSLARRRDGNPAIHELEQLTRQEVFQVEPAVFASRIKDKLDAIEKQIDRITIERPDIVDGARVGTSLVTGLASVSSRVVSVVRPGSAQSILYIVADELIEDAGQLPCLLQSFDCLGYKVHPVRWDRTEKRLELLTAPELIAMGWAAAGISEDCPKAAEPKYVVDPMSCASADWLLIPGSVRLTDSHDHTSMNLAIEARRLRIRSAFIFKGAEPLRLRRHAGVEAAAHERYMQALLLADLVVTTSVLATNDLHAFLIQHQNADTGPSVRFLSMPGPGGSGGDVWSSYARTLWGTLVEAADRGPRLGSLYYFIDSKQQENATPYSVAQRLPQVLADFGIALVPVGWSRETKQLIPSDVSMLGGWKRFDGSSLAANWVPLGANYAPNWLLLPDARSDLPIEEISEFARARGVRSAAILQEGENLDGVGTATSTWKSLYEGIARFDKTLAVDQTVYAGLYRFLLSWRGKLNSAEDRFKLVPMPNEVPGIQRRALPKKAIPGKIRIVTRLSSSATCDVNILVQAIAEAAKSHGLLAHLTIEEDDNPGVHGSALGYAKSVGGAAISWIGKDGTSFEQALEDADFAFVLNDWGKNAAFASECLWRGVPVLAGSGERPLKGNGCAYFDCGNTQQLIDSMRTMMRPAFRSALAYEATARTTTSWNSYARAIIDELVTDRLVDCLNSLVGAKQKSVYDSLVNLERRPKLSVCISTYNRGGWVALSLKNIFGQIPLPRADLEVLVVDNTSTDNTAELIQPYISRPDFRYVRNPKNVGMLGNLAVTAQMAKGEHIWILGDDDLTRPGTIERVLEILREHPRLPLIFMNYGYTTEGSSANITDLDAFLAGYNKLEPAGPDEFSKVKHIAAKCENFYTAIWSHIYRRDHALKSYCQDTSGRIFSTMLACVPTAYYVLNYMFDEDAYWIGEPALVVNSNVSWTEYAPLFELEQFPRTWDLAERMGTSAAEVDRRRANRLWLTEIMWKQIFDQEDRSGNRAYFSASRVLMRLKHLPEIDAHITEFIKSYNRARRVQHPAAVMSTEDLFSAFPDVIARELLSTTVSLQGK